MQTVTGFFFLVKVILRGNIFVSIYNQKAKYGLKMLLS